MSDVNASIVAVDSAMDCVEKINDSMVSFQRMVSFDINELGRALEIKKRRFDDRLSELYERLAAAEEAEQSREEDAPEDASSECSQGESPYCAAIREEIREVERKIAHIEDLILQQRRLAFDFKRDSEAILGSADSLKKNGLRSMAQYIRLLTDVAPPPQIASRGGYVNPFNGESGYYVAVVNASRHPESAEHIRAATNLGHPAILTLHRKLAKKNRKESLEQKPARSYYDRDEFPPAAFLEGGAGASVNYISRSDNRGSGSSFSHQLRGVADGSRVRFRIIEEKL